MKYDKLIKHFDFTKMRELPKSDFNIQVGDKWANEELQHYVDKPENIFFDNGLVLRATFKDGIYESARINTKNKFSFRYGRIEVVAKVPAGRGTWPAIWLLSETMPYGHWPQSGEIDIMEHVGRKVNHAFLCLHSRTYNHTQTEQFYQEVKVDNAIDEFHKYGLIWDETSIAYVIDDKEVVRYSKYDKDDQTINGWPFDHNFYLILNLAIGGKFGGSVDDSCFPQDFIIKEVKVYQ